MDAIPNNFLVWAQSTPQLKHHISECVVLGDRKLANNIDKLRQMRVTAVLNCGAGQNSFEGWDNVIVGFLSSVLAVYLIGTWVQGQGATMRYLKLQVRDSPKAELLPLLEEATHFVEEERKRGGVVLVHCMGGFSRSPAVVAAWLIRCGGMTVDEALAVIRVKRPCARPNDGFMKQLQKWATQCAAKAAAPTK